MPERRAAWTAAGFEMRAETTSRFPLAVVCGGLGVLGLLARRRRQNITAA
jgi:hypothetical protein